MRWVRRVVILSMVLNVLWWTGACATLLWELRSADHPAYRERRTRSGHYYRSDRATQNVGAVIFYGLPVAWAGRSLYLVTRGRDEGDRAVGAMYYAILTFLCAAALLALRSKLTWDELSPSGVNLRAGWFAACAAAAAGVALAREPRGG
jgi:hypothetical protein